MTKSTKARNHNSSKFQDVLDEITPLEMEQTKVKMQIAARIEDFMKARNWSKSQFAANVGKNPSEITKWLSGTQNFTIDVLTQIASTFGIELAALLGGKQIQVIYRKEIFVKSMGVSNSIQLKTPYDDGIDVYEASLLKSQGIKSTHP